MGIITYKGKSYNAAFLKRCVCQVCGKRGEDLEDYFYRIYFSKELEEIKKQYPEYEKLECGSRGNYICWGCCGELFAEFPETIEKIEKIIQA